MAKFAFLVGCCYPGKKDALKGCYNDVAAMKNLLINMFGFDPCNVSVLTDMAGSRWLPTGRNIKWKLYRMIEQLQGGDVLVFYFSGHGMHKDSEEGPYCKREEAIVPCDSNLIFSADFRDMVNRMPAGAYFIMIADSSNSGGLIDQSKEQVGPGFRPDVCYPIRTNKNDDRPGLKAKMMAISSIVQELRTTSHIQSSDIHELLRDKYGTDASIKLQRSFNPELPIPFKVDRGILISACQSNESAKEDQRNYPSPRGLFTNALCSTLRHVSGPISNKLLVEIIRDKLERQRPCLYCSDKRAKEPFLQDF